MEVALDRRWKLVALALLIAGSWPLAAGSGQPGAGSTQQQSPQTFRSGTQVVQVDVRVLKDGRFVTDLGPSDFTITEDGVGQRVDAVALIGAAAAVQAPQAPDASAAALRGAVDRPDAPPAVWVFVFDTEHLTISGLTRARNAVVAFIGDRFHEGDLGGVVSDGKMANNRLTSTRAELKAAAAAVTLPGELRSRQLELRAWPPLLDDEEVWRIATGDQQARETATNRACVVPPDECHLDSKHPLPGEDIVLEKARRMNTQTQLASLKTLKSVEALSNGLARIPGAKTIVFLSEGFFLNDKGAELRQAVGQAARAGAHFYTLDARGLNKGSASSNIIDRPAVVEPFASAQQFDTQTDGMNSLAVDTGGFAIRNENNFGRALDEIQQDSRTYYVVSYTATNSAFDGKYRTIDVGVDRPGVKVRARRGYLAVDPATLLRPARAVSAAATPKRPSEGSNTKAGGDLVPDLPVSPGLIALPDAFIPGEIVLASHDTTTTAVRARIDGGKMVAALRSASGGGESSGGVGGTASTEGAAELGWAAYEKGDLVTASKHLAEAASAADARPWVHYALGLSEFAQKRYKEAAVAWERVVRDVPEFEPIYFSLADAHGLQHDEGTALKVLREAQRRWPADPEIYDAIGVIQVKRGAVDAAIDSFDTATKVAPQEALGWFNLGRTLQMRWVKASRYDRERERWVGPEDDRKRAEAAYQRYVEIGGPYDAQAKQALAALAWK